MECLKINGTENLLPDNTGQYDAIRCEDCETEVRHHNSEEENHGRWVQSFSAHQYLQEFFGANDKNEAC